MHILGRLKFPSFAAGGLCTPSALLNFLLHLTIAYNTPGGKSGAISHATARLMLGEESLVDKGSVEFMRAKVCMNTFINVMICCMFISVSILFVC